MNGTYNDVVNTAKRGGIAALSNAELVGLILRSGKQSLNQFKVAEEITAGEGLYETAARASMVGELNYIVGNKLTERQELSLLSAIELGKRLNGCGAFEMRVRLASPGDAASYLMSMLRHETHEKFVVVLLDAKNRVMSTRQVSEGSLTSAVVHPREVFAPAVVMHAASILVAHNHPSGDPEPSKEDKQLTEALEKAGELLGIPLLDHVIIGDGRHYSFKEHDII